MQHKQEQFIIQYQESLKINSKYSLTLTFMTSAKMVFVLRI